MLPNGTEPKLIEQPHVDLFGLDCLQNKKGLGLGFLFGLDCLQYKKRKLEKEKEKKKGKHMDHLEANKAKQRTNLKTKNNK